MRGWLRRKLHAHRWHTILNAQMPHDFGMGQEMATGTVRGCYKCLLIDWSTFQIEGPTVRLENERRRAAS